MTLVLKRRLAVGAAAVAVGLTGVGTAYACDGGGSHAARANAATIALFRHDGGGMFLGVTAGYLGLTTDQVKSALMDGKTLAQIAPAGKTASGLAEALAAAAKTKLDAAVASGKLTQDQENAWLAMLSTKLTAAANAAWNASTTGFESSKSFAGFKSFKVGGHHELHWHHR